MRRRPVFAPLAVLALTLLPLAGCLGGAVNTNHGGANTSGNVTVGPVNTNGPTNTNTISPPPSPSPGGTPGSNIDAILSRMEVGEIAFNVPPSMRLHEAQTIVLLLSPVKTAGELEQELRKEVVTGNVQQATIKISDTMQAVLSGDGFQINPITPDTLPVSKQETTQWRWDVRPQRGGALRLHVVLNAIVEIGGAGPRPYPLRTFSQTYVVDVPWREGAVATFFKDNWPWLWATVLLPGVALLWNRNRSRRRAAARRALFRGEGAGIFISYRRDDAAGHVGRLHDALASHFGPGRVFRDLDSIGYGEDFVEVVEKAVGSCAVVVVVIGRQWLEVTDSSGRRRLDSPRDFVHLEIATALRRGAKVIPALVEGAAMPSEDVLPAPLAELARRNAIEISDSRWQFDVERLIEALEAELERRAAGQPEPGASQQ